MAAIFLPSDLYERSPTLDDVQAIANVVIADENAETGHTDTIPEDLLEIWDAHEMDLEHNARVLTTADGTIVAYAGIMVSDDGFELDPHTREHPDYYTHQLKPYLLRFIEERAQAYLLQHPEHPRHISTQCFSAPWISFLKNNGYKQQNHYLRMEITLQEAPAVHPLAGITIRHYQAGQDEPAIHAVIQDAFQDIGMHPYRPFEEWLEGSIHRKNFDPDILHVAEVNGNIVGAVLGRGYPEDASGFISQVAVARDWRKKGIALALLQTAFAEYFRKGMPKVSLDVDDHNRTGAHDLYRRAGMQRTSESAILEKDF